MSKTTENNNETIHEESKDNLEELVPYTVPVDDTERKSETLVISLNGKPLRLQRGETVMIPRKYFLLIQKKTQLRKMDREYKKALEKAIAEENK